MKASELIQRLEEQIRLHGDIDVCIDIDSEVTEDLGVYFEDFDGDCDEEDKFIAISNSYE